MELSFSWIRILLNINNKSIYFWPWYLIRILMMDLKLGIIDILCLWSNIFHPFCYYHYVSTNIFFWTNIFILVFFISIFLPMSSFWTGILIFAVYHHYVSTNVFFWTNLIFAVFYYYVHTNILLLSHNFIQMVLLKGGL